MRKNIGVQFWNYGQRLWLELIMALAVLGLATALAAELMPLYLQSAKLTEPVGIARDLEKRMVINRAITGEWPMEKELLSKHDKFPDSIRSLKSTDLGNIEITLNGQYWHEPENILGFSVAALETQEGFYFYSWSCGSAEPVKGFYPQGQARNTLPSLYTYVICREKHDN